MENLPRLLIIFILLALTSTKYVYSQKNYTLQSVKLEQHINTPTFNIIEPERRLFNKRVDFNIPDSIKKFRLSIYCVDYNQYVQQNYSENRADSFWLRESLRLKLIESKTEFQNNINCFTHVLYYNRISDGRLMIVFDSDNDFDFTKERQYEYSIFERDSLDNVFVTCRNISIVNYNNGQFGSQQYNVKPIVSKSMNIDSLQIRYKTKNKPLTGYFQHANQRFSVNVFTQNTSQKYDSLSSYFYFLVGDQAQPKNVKLFNYYRLKEKIESNHQKGYYFEVDSIEQFGSRIWLKVGRSGNKITGTKFGNYFESIICDDIENRKIDFKQTFSQSKFTVIEFWGTWCGPCLSIANDYDLMTRKFLPLGMGFISIAYDQERLEVINFLSKHPKLGINIFDNQASATSLSKRLRIESYPTFFVVDRNGKIVFRDEGTTGFLNLSSFVTSKF